MSEAGDIAWVRTYVNDHRAGAAGGIALMRRCRDANAASELGALLDEILPELEEDAGLLADLAASLGLRPNPVKPGLARAAELVGRLKLNGRWFRYSPTSRLLELEALLAGIDARRSLWLALHAAEVPAAPGVDFAELAARAEEERRRLRPHHAGAARDALAPASGRAPGVSAAGPAAPVR
jgi:hypothetical protein